MPDTRGPVPSSDLSPKVPVYWFLCGSRDVASSRLQGYLIDEFLKARGWKSILWCAPPFLRKDIPWRRDELSRLASALEDGIVVIQKLRGSNTRKLLYILKERGIPTVYVQADYYPNDDTPLLCDWIVCSSRQLRNYFDNKHERVWYIPDPAEFMVEEPKLHYGLPLNLMWVGNRSHWPTLSLIRQILAQEEFRDFKLVTISDHPDATLKWDRKKVFKYILEGDIGIIPVRDDGGYWYKSSNRAITLMGCGLPVIVGDLPAYREVVQNGINGFVCRSRDEWVRALRVLRSEPLRRRMAWNALEFVRDKYSLKVIGQEWMALFNGVMNEVRIRRGSSMQIRKYIIRNELQSMQHIRVGLTAMKRGLWLTGVRNIIGGFFRLPLAPYASKYVIRYMVRRIFNSYFL